MTFNWRFLAPFVLAIFALLGGCSPDPNEAANKLFVQAQQDLRTAESLDADVHLRALKSAKLALNTIVEKYPASQLAVQISSGQVVGEVSVKAIEAKIAIAEWQVCVAKPTRACLSAESQRTMDTVTGDREKTEAFTVVAIALARGSQYARSVELANRINQRKERSQALRLIANALIEAGHLDDALKLAQTNELREDSDHVRLRLAQAHVQKGNYTQAFDIAPKNDKDDLLLQASLRESDLGRSTQAESLIVEIADASKRENARKALRDNENLRAMQARAKKEALRDAHLLLNFLDTDDRIPELLDISLVQAENGFHETSAAIQREAFTLAVKATPDGQAYPVSAVTQWLAGQGRGEEAQAYLVTSLTRLNSRPQVRDILIQEERARIANRLIQANHIPLALDILNATGLDKHKAAAVRELATVKSLDAAIEIARTIKNSSLRAGAIMEMAMAAQ